MSSYNFKPNFEIIKTFQGKYNISDLEKEVGVYSATPQFLRDNCGDIAKNILNQIPDWYYVEADKLGLYPNVDVRIHRLYPGDFPAYPGWHCDGEFRETYFSQPDLNKIKVSRHITCTVSSCDEGVSNTQFLLEPFECQVDSPSSENTLWGQVHALLSKKNNKKSFDTKDGQMMLFDSWSLHRAMATKTRG